MRENGPVSTFPTVTGSARGYDVAQVEAFLAVARAAYTAEDDGAATQLNSDEIRTTAFAMVRDGYVPAVVDAAMERLEEAFAQREREREIAEQGEAAWNAAARADAQAVLDRLARPDRSRFRRSGLATGYRMADVDAFAERIIGYLQHGEPLSTAEVRGVVFRAARFGYDEAQVDLVLDTLTRTMLAVR